MSIRDHLIEERMAYSQGRIQTLKNKLVSSSELQAKKDFCIYTTGSYGRLEASPYSDIDLFFISDNKNEKFSKISKILIDSHVIQACREMMLPEFSGDGEYLEIHNRSNIYQELGSRKDDFMNFFTARILLLLESKCIYNEKFYKETIETTIEKYYKDFHEHEKDFKPVFLVNDVIRFWRTVCLNYEHSRNRKFTDKLSREEIEIKKSEVNIKNLKLKFSRKLTCYSFLINVLYLDGVVKQEDILEIINLTPLQRLDKISDIGNIKNDIGTLVSLYHWFLHTTQVDKSTLITWMRKEENKNEAFEKSREFSKIMFKIMIEAKNHDNLMYFLI